MSRYEIVNGRQSQVDSSGRLTPRGKGSDYLLPTASPIVKGGVRIGANLSMLGDVLSADDMRYDDDSIVTELLDIQAEIQEILDTIAAGGVLEPRVQALEFVLSDLSVSLFDLSALVDSAEQNVSDLMTGKQDLLVSGDNIATINGNDLLAGGDIVISGGSSAPTNPFTATTNNLPTEFAAGMNEIWVTAIAGGSGGEVTYEATEYFGDARGGRSVVAFSISGAPSRVEIYHPWAESTQFAPRLTAGMIVWSAVTWNKSAHAFPVATHLTTTYELPVGDYTATVYFHCI